MAAVGSVDWAAAGWGAVTARAAAGWAEMEMVVAGWAAEGSVVVEVDLEAGSDRWCTRPTRGR